MMMMMRGKKPGISNERQRMKKESRKAPQLLNLNVLPGGGALQASLYTYELTFSEHGWMDGQVLSLRNSPLGPGLMLVKRAAAAFSVFVEIQ